MAWNWEAKGHIARVMLFDSETVFIPLHKAELSRMISIWRDRMSTLTNSGDYPEAADDKMTYDNLLAADFLLSQNKIKE